MQKNSFEKIDALLLTNGSVLNLTENRTFKADVLIKDGTIEKISTEKIVGFQGRTLDVRNHLIIPGLVDMHVHFREPGFEHKETLATGAAAAMAGGFTTVCTMPNTKPAMDNEKEVKYQYEQLKDHLVQVRPIAAITRKRQGQILANLRELLDAGAAGFSDDGSPVMNAQLMLEALEFSAKYQVPIIQHCEDIYLAGNGVMHRGEISRQLGLPGIPGIAEDVIVARDLILAEQTGGHLHIAHISTAQAVDLVRQAKKRGVRVTCEVAPHHFTLDEHAVQKLEPNMKMNPPLRSKADVAAILHGLSDGTIDVIASDHAPHTEAEKGVGFLKAPFGIIGLETMLALTQTYLVDKQILTLSETIIKMSRNPAKILGLTIPEIKVGAAANLTIYDPKKVWRVDKHKFRSKSTNMPFHGWLLNGAVLGVFNRGRFWGVNQDF